MGQVPQSGHPGPGGLDMLEQNALWVFDVPQAAPKRKKILISTIFPLLPQMSSADSKGDILLISDHVVELLTKMYQAVLDATQKQLSVAVTEK